MSKAEKVRRLHILCVQIEVVDSHHVAAVLYYLLFQIHMIPLEVAILGMQDKIQSLRSTLDQNPPDGKLLQMQLQGGIATAVNQVRM